MSSDKNNLQQVHDAIEALRGEVSQLGQRMTQLESLVSNPLDKATSPEAERVDEELVLTISAAIAAYLGVKPHIRQIRLVSNDSWALSGRATIQDSHTVAPRHG